MLVEKNHTLHTIVILGQRNGAERVKIAQALINVMPIRNAEAKETQSIFEIKW
jgi:hypothetical protein